MEYDNYASLNNDPLAGSTASVPISYFSGGGSSGLGVSEGFSIKSILKELNIPATGEPDTSKAFVNNMIQNSTALSQMYQDAGSPEVLTSPGDYGDPGLYLPQGNNVTFRQKAFDSNQRLVSTILHELYHGIQYHTPSSILGDKTQAEWARSNYGDIDNKFSVGKAFLERQAYGFQIKMGDNSSNTLYWFNYYNKRFTDGLNR